MRLDDLAIRTQTPLDTDKVLFEKFRTHDRVEFDPKTNLYSFKVSLLLSDILFES
jgi:transcription initiation factor TFIIE subunit beta